MTMKQLWTLVLEMDQEFADSVTEADRHGHQPCSFAGPVIARNLRWL